jgi:hypothetical protein
MTHEEKLVPPFRVKVWERLLVRAQEGHGPSVDALVAWDRWRTEQRAAWERQKGKR